MAKGTKKLLRVPDAVAYLDGVVGQPAIRGWILRGEIETVRVGGRVCIPVEALDRMIERGTRACRTRSRAKVRGISTHRKGLSR
jgi:excisionase family DNA binding protein